MSNNTLSWRRPAPLAAVVAATVLLAGCKSDEARLDEFLRSSDAYMEQGDLPRAMLQMGNALQIAPADPRVRAGMGRILMRQGDLPRARSEFQFLAEARPRDLAWRHALGEIAARAGDWSALDDQLRAAQGISEDAFETRALSLAARYRDAVTRSDAAERERLIAAARDLLAERPSDGLLVHLTVGHLAAGRDPAAALPILDAALDEAPHRPTLQLERVRLLSQDGRDDAARARLLNLAQLYPGDARISALLVAHHLSQGDLDGAEAVLRALAEGMPRAEMPVRLSLVRFLRRHRGEAAALAELDALIALAGDTPAGRVWAAMDLAIRHDAGQASAGATDDVAARLAALAEAEGASREGQVIRVLLARIQDAQGDAAAARRTVDAILARDPGAVGALKLRATWAIERDDAGAAVVDLRAALGQAPQDTEAMTLLAAAHRTGGEDALALEQLARAAEVSGHGAAESLRYAAALLSRGRRRVAAHVLEAALDAAPRNVPLLRALAQVHVQAGAWGPAARLSDELAAIDAPEAQVMARALHGLVLDGRGRGEAAGAHAAALATEGPGGRNALAAMVRDLGARGRVGPALDYLRRARAAAPDDPDLALLEARTLAAAGEVDTAEAILRASVATGGGPDAHLQLFLLLRDAARADEARAALAAGLDAHPADRRLLLVEASRLEADGRIDAARALYERLHAAQPSDLVVANNLAALISVTSDDPSELARAARMVAPFDRSGLAAVDDTIGWLAFRRGDAQSALPPLRRAARGRPADPAVHMRLGEVHAALGRTDQARTAFRTARDLAATPELTARAQARIDALGG